MIIETRKKINLSNKGQGHTEGGSKQADNANLDQQREELAILLLARAQIEAGKHPDDVQLALVNTQRVLALDEETKELYDLMSGIIERLANNDVAYHGEHVRQEISADIKKLGEKIKKAKITNKQYEEFRVCIVTLCDVILRSMADQA